MEILSNPTEISTTLTELAEFTDSKPFVEMVNELYKLKSDDRRKFVRDVLLSQAEIEKRSIFLPDRVSIERSYFTDNRPTLFCVVKYLEDKKRKVTITFDE